MQRIFTMLIATALAVMVLAVPVAADENTPAELRNFGDASLCDLEKLDTWSQQFRKSDQSPVYQTVNFGEPDYWWHFEPYTSYGVRTVSWVLPPMTPATMTDIFGGSVWRGSCSPGQFSYVDDAANYAIGRYVDGHSGLVVVVSPMGDACTVVDTTLGADADVTPERLDYINSLLYDQVRHMSVALCPNMNMEVWDLQLSGYVS